MSNNTQFAEISSNSFPTHSIQPTDIASLQKKVSKPHHAAWSAFQAGMQILQHYAGRFPANPEAIAKANLQLLHQSLLNDPSYIQSLKKVRNRNTNSLPNSYCIYETKGLRADLLTLNAGTTIQLTPYQDRCAMYLSITGKPSIQSPNNTTSLGKHWWNRYSQKNSNAVLKNGDAVVLSPRGGTNKLLTAEKNGCILLRVQIPKS